MCPSDSSHGPSAAGAWPRRLGILAGAAQRLARATTPAQMLRDAAWAATEVSGSAGAAAGWVVDGNLRFDELLEAGDFKPIEWNPPELVSPRGMEMLREGRQLTCGQAPSRPLLGPRLADQARQHHLLLSPVRDAATGELLGAIAVQRPRDGHAYAPADRQCLATLCQALAVARTQPPSAITAVAEGLLGNPQLLTIVDFLPDATFVIDKHQRVVAWNPAMEEMTGVPRQAIVGKGDRMYAMAFYGDRRQMLIDMVEQEHPEKSPAYDYIRREGRTLYTEAYVPSVFARRGAYLWATASPLLDERGQVVGAIESIRDITARKKSEIATRQMEQQLKVQNTVLAQLSSSPHLANGNLEAWFRELTEAMAKALGTSQCGFWTLSPDGRQLRCVCQYSVLTGRHQHGRVLDMDHYAAYRQALLHERVLAIADTQHDDRTSPLREDYYKPADIVSQMDAVVRRGGKAVGVFCNEQIATRRDWTAEEQNFAAAIADMLALAMEAEARRQAQIEAQHQRDLAETLVNNAQAIILVLDSDLRVLRFNAFAQTLTGYSEAELVGRPVTEILVKPADKPRLMDITRRTLAGEPSRDEDLDLATKDGRDLTIRWYTSTLYDTERNVRGILAIGHDMTEIRLKEEQLRQAQKMEAVGRLAGGVAHDFNNQLTVVKGYCDLLLRELPAESETRSLIEEIRNAAVRAESLTSQLLAFSRKQILRAEIVNLNDVLNELANPLKRMIGEDIQMAIIANPLLGVVKADANQVKQAIINLIINARDAMPHGGRIRMETENVQLDEEHVRQHMDASAGPHIMLSISDSGSGMDPATLKRIFEPFFTTKPVGQGTGLGLAMVYGFVKQSGGHITVDSESGRGTCFRIFLPRVYEDYKPVEPAAAIETPYRGSETLLITEDDRSVRELIVRVLRQSGYRVLEAALPAEALTIARKHLNVLDLLITDVVMPGMNGAELAAQIRRIRPELPVLFITGYAERAAASQAFIGPTTRLLTKPFRPNKLAEMIRKLLDEVREAQQAKA